MHAFNLEMQTCTSRYEKEKEELKEAIIKLKYIEAQLNKKSISDTNKITIWSLLTTTKNILRQLEESFKYGVQDYGR